MQRGLAEWQKFLSDKPLPILGSTKAEVQSLINQAQLSITQYASPILFDAGLSASIFHQVNAQRVSAGRNSLTTLDNALSHMGQNAFQAFLNKVTLIDDLKLPERNVRGYMRTMGQACHAALQARDWSQQRNVVQPEEPQLAALLQSITELLLWCHGENVMPEIEQQHYVKKQAYEDAAKQVLGCGMRELGAAIAEKWHMPEMVTDGLRSRRDNFTLATGVSLAFELAREVSMNWYSQAAMDVITSIAKYKGKAEGEIEHRLHLNAVNMTDELQSHGYDVPAKLLPLLADDAYIDAQFSLQAEADFAEKTVEKTTAMPDEKTALKPDAKSSVKTQKQTLQQESLSKPVLDKARLEKDRQEKDKPEKTTLDNARQEKISLQKNAITKKQSDKSVKQTSIKNPIKEQQDDSLSTSVAAPAKAKTISSELAAAVKEFKLMVEQGKHAHDLIEYMVNICLLCGVQRCVFLIKIPDKKILVSRYVACSSDGIEIKALKIPLDKPHVFTLLMEKSRNLFLNDSNRTKYWNFIPGPVKLQLGVKQFFAMSIFVNTHAMGMMYADKVKGELTQEEFSQFQAICRLLSKGIIQSAHNKKKL